MSVVDCLLYGVVVGLIIAVVRRWTPVKVKTAVERLAYSGRLQSFLLLTGVAIVAALLIQQVIIRVFL